jgi:hypothetical protein
VDLARQAQIAAGQWRTAPAATPQH